MNSEDVINLLKILVVTNSKTMLNELEGNLSDICPEATIIKETDALMAGKYAFNHEIDVVFAEADMKRMNGLQLIQFVRQEHPEVKSFIVGTERELSESFLTVSEDVTGVLEYPFAGDEIFDALQKC